MRMANVAFMLHDGSQLHLPVATCRTNAKLAALLASGMRETATLTIKLDKDVTRDSMAFLLAFIASNRLALPSALPPFPALRGWRALADEWLEPALVALMDADVAQSMTVDSWPEMFVFACDIASPVD